MSEAQITWQRLATLVVEVSDKVRDPQAVRPESHLFKDVGLSSMMAVSLVMDLEREFDIVVKEEDFDHLHTVGDLLQVIENRRRGAPP